VTALADAFFTAWLAMALLSGAAIAAVAIWAWRARQFSRPKRAARLPLQAGIPDDEPPPASTGQAGGNEDRSHD